MKKFIISIDAGTTSNRSILFDLKGRPIFSSQKEFTQYFPKNGWVEHDPEEIWKTTIKTLKEVLKKAKKHSNFLRIDMESSRSTDITFKIYNQLKSTYSETGVVLQAYLRRSLKDIQGLSSHNFNARICKGIYQENSKIAIKDSKKIRDNFLKMAKLMSEKKSYACYATHDQHLIDSLLDMIKKHNIDSSTFEFQVLYGVPMNGRLEELLSLGYKVRVYVPFGPDWYDYSLRRLKENPDIAGYVLKNLFSKNS